MLATDFNSPSDEATVLGSIGEGDMVKLYAPSRFDVPGRWSRTQSDERFTVLAALDSAVSENDEFGGVYLFDCECASVYQ
jgi:hypothetical protein